MQSHLILHRQKMFYLPSDLQHSYHQLHSSQHEGQEVRRYAIHLKPPQIESRLVLLWLRALASHYRTNNIFMQCHQEVKTIRVVILSPKLISPVSISSQTAFSVSTSCIFTHSQYPIVNICTRILVPFIILAVLRYIPKFGIALEKPLVFDDMLISQRAKQLMRLLVSFTTYEYSGNVNVSINEQRKQELPLRFCE